jgi:hypothetical protein
MEMRIDEGRGDQIAARVDLGRRGARQFLLDRPDRFAGTADIGNSAVRQRAAAHDKVEIHLSSPSQDLAIIVAEKTASRSLFFPRQPKGSIAPQLAL